MLSAAHFLHMPESCLLLLHAKTTGREQPPLIQEKTKKMSHEIRNKNREHLNCRSALRAERSLKTPHNNLRQVACPAVKTHGFRYRPKSRATILQAGQKLCKWQSESQLSST